MIHVNDIFLTIQGESSRAGLTTVFVRTSGCNLRCSYCDTAYAYSGGQPLTVEDTVEKVLQLQTKYVCVTGGEPLLQPDIFQLLKSLCNHNKEVSLETNGSISCANVDPRVKIILDIKTPGSGTGDCFLLENLSLPFSETEIKFVICSEEDFIWAENFCMNNQLFKRFSVLYSPSFDEKNEKWLAKKILSKRSSARLHLQLHKYIWSSESTL